MRPVDRVLRSWWHGRFGRRRCRSGRRGAVALSGVLAFLALGLAASMSVAKGDPTGQASGRQGPDGAGGQYIVVLKDSTGDPQAVAQDHGRRYGVPVDLVYTRAIKGYATRMSARQLEQVRGDPAVDFVGRDREVKATGTVSLASGESAPTGVRRIDAATPPPPTPPAAPRWR